MPGLDLTDISGAAAQQQRNTLTPIKPTASQVQQVTEEEAPVESLPERTAEPNVIEKDGHLIKTGGAKIKTNPFLQEVDGSKKGEVQIQAGEVDDAQREFLKKTTWVE